MAILNGENKAVLARESAPLLRELGDAAARILIQIGNHHEWRLSS